MEVPKRVYNQYCALARSLEIVGERWTLLIVRELLEGPKRYKDLVDGLPGIGTNLLAGRLKELERFGVIRKYVLAPPAASTVYDLTGHGKNLKGVITELERWGLPYLGPPRENDFYRPLWSILAMETTFRPVKARGLHEAYEFRIEDAVFFARVDDGKCELGPGPATDPNLIISCDTHTFLAIAAHQLSHKQAVESGRLRIVRGNLAILDRVGRIFGLPPFHEELEFEDEHTHADLALGRAG